MKQLPEITDEFAKQYGAENTEALREGVFNDLENELNTTQKRKVRDQLIKHLLTTVQCELPESVVDQETKNVVYELVRENQQRGVAKETIDEKKDEIYSAAATSAKDRVKVAFIIGKIAAEEGVKVSSEEVNQRIIMMAQSYNMAPDQLAKKLKDVCFADCYLRDKRKHREGCECFKPRDLIIHHCCPMENVPCIGCNCIHLPGKKKKVIKRL